MASLIRKVYVDMDVYWGREGDIKPRVVIWEDGAKYNVDRILDVRQAASLKAGGCGIRYTVRICGRERFIFLEDNKWFVEGRSDS